MAVCLCAIVDNQLRRCNSKRAAGPPFCLFREGTAQAVQAASAAGMNDSKIFEA